MYFSLLFTLFFFNDTATTEIYTLSLHDALPICERLDRARLDGERAPRGSEQLLIVGCRVGGGCGRRVQIHDRSEEHTSELQSRVDLVCRLLLEKKKKKKKKTR